MKKGIVHMKKLNLQDICASLIAILAVLENIARPAHYICAGLQLLLAFEIMCYLVLNSKIVLGDVLLVGGVMITGAANMMLIGQMDLPKLLKVLSHFPAAVYLADQSIRRNTDCWKMTGKFIFFFILVWWGLFGKGEMLFHSASRNYVSIFLILALFLVAAGSCTDTSMQIQPYYYWLLLLASVLAVGRNGIICALFVNAVYYLYVFFLKQDRTYQNRFIFCMTGLGVLAVLMCYGFIKSDFIVQKYFSRFVDGTQVGSNIIRKSILRDYWESLHNPRNLFLGVDAAGLSDFLKDANGNLHCSYFMVQAAFGIIPFLVFLALMIRTEYLLFLEKKTELLILLTAFLLRVLTDTAFPNHLGDIAAWYLVLYPYHRNGKRKPVRLTIQTGV